MDEKRIQKLIAFAIVLILAQTAILATVYLEGTSWTSGFLQGLESFMTFMTSLVISGLSWISTVFTNENSLKILDNISGVIFGIIKIPALIVILVFLIMFIRWLSKDEGMIILPFEVAGYDDNYNGKAISDLLTVELERIRQIHKREYKGVVPIKTENLSIPQIDPSCENLSYSITKLGPIGMGSTSVHLGPILAYLKRLWPNSDNGQFISGSLQRYGSVISLAACQEHKGIKSWETSCKIKDHSKITEEHIPNLIREMSFQIAQGLSTKISANTCKGFRYYTEALEAYHQYNLTEDPISLERARKNCIKAANLERKYEEPMALLYNLGVIYINISKYEKAEAVFRKMLDLNSHDDRALSGIGLIYILQDKYEEAFNLFNIATMINPDDVDTLYNKGVALREMGEIEKAIECYDEVLKKKPNDGHTLLNKGAALYYMGKPKKAIKCYNKVLKRNHDHAEALANKGAALYYMGKPKKAIKCYNKVLKRNHCHAGALVNKGVAVHYMGNIETAVDCFDEVLKRNPDHANALYNKGLALEKLDKWTEAVKCYEKLIELNATSATTHNTLARLYRKMGQYAKSAEQCKLARQLIETESKYNQACCEAVCGSAEEALKLLEIALKDNQVHQDLARQDPDFEFIRSDPNFKEEFQKLITDSSLKRKLRRKMKSKDWGFKRFHP